MPEEKLFSVKRIKLKPRPKVKSKSELTSTTFNLCFNEIKYDDLPEASVNTTIFSSPSDNTDSAKDDLREFIDQQSRDRSNNEINIPGYLSFYRSKSLPSLTEPLVKEANLCYYHKLKLLSKIYANEINKIDAKEFYTNSKPIIVVDEIKSYGQPFPKESTFFYGTNELDRLRAEELYLLQMKNIIEYQKIRLPKPNWYSLTDSTFNVECRQNNLFNRNRTKTTNLLIKNIDEKDKLKTLAVYNKLISLY